MTSSVLPLSFSPEDSLPVPTHGRFRPLRSGVQNLWQHDTVRTYRNGWMLNRGVNGSGKSIFLGLQVPFLLDGRPATALPPASPVSGSRGSLKDLILDRDRYASRVGYTWIEFGRLDPEGRVETVTCGAGLRASRAAADVRAWYFVTGHRIGRDLQLFDAAGLPAEAADLRALLGADHVFDDVASYRAALDSALFGLGEERLRRLARILREVSRPNLASNLTAEAAGQYIADFLEPIAPRLFEQIAEHFSSQATLTEQVRRLKDDAAAMSQVTDAHRAYAQALLRRLAFDLRDGDSRFQAASTARRDADAALGVADDRARRLEQGRGEATLRNRGLSEAVRTLELSDPITAARDLDSAERAVAKALHAVRAAETEVAKQDGRVRTMTGRHEEALRDLRAVQADARRWERSAERAATQAVLTGDHTALVEVMGGETGGGEEAVPPDGDLVAARTRLSSAVRRRDRAITDLVALAERARRAADAAARAAEAVSERRVAREAAEIELAGARERRDEAEEALLEALLAWAAGCRELRPGDAGRASLRAAVEERRSLAAAVHALARPLSGAVAQERASALLAGQRSRSAAEDLRRRREEIAAQRDEGPAALPARVRAEGCAGVPLWRVCDFAPGFEDEARQGGIEAALEGAGLLDVLVLPDGAVLGADSLDAALVAGAPVEGPSLADVLVPDGDGVPAATVTALLRRIGLGSIPGAAVTVGPDGGYVLGPVVGRFAKVAAEHIGAAARERTRVRRIAELDAEITAREAEAEAADRRVAAADERTAAIAADIAAAPDETALREAEAAVPPAERALADAEARLAVAAERQAAADAAATTARQALDRRASETGLAAWLDDLPGLASATREYRDHAAAWIDAVGRWGVAATAAARAAEDLAESTGALAERRDAVLRTGGDHAEALARRGALEAQAQAAGVREALAQLEQARGELVACTGEVERLQREEMEAAAERTRCQIAVERAAERLDETARTRDAAEESLRSAAVAGLLECAGWGSLRDGLAEDPRDWRLTHLLTAIARSRQAGDRAPGADEARGRLNRLMATQTQVSSQLVDYSFVIDAGEADHWIPRGVYQGAARPLHEVRDLVSADAQRNDGLIAEEERRFFDAVMLNQVSTELNAALRTAETHVARITDCMQAHPTRRGHRVRIRWQLRAGEVPDGTREVLDLVARDPHLHTDAERDLITRWMKSRVDEAREGRDGTLADRLTAGFDYRAWHQVVVQLAMPGSDRWDRFRSQRAVLSEGERAALLHLPLLAAVATAYDGAREGAPRIFGLDEAFERIDDGMREACFGVISALDLDVLMANYSMMPTYASVPGIAINIMSVYPEIGGVGVTTMFWDGERLEPVDE